MGPPPAEEFVQARVADWVAPEKSAEKSQVEKLQVRVGGWGLWMGCFVGRRGVGG
jgi:hypothetical protein